MHVRHTYLQLGDPFYWPAYNWEGDKKGDWTWVKAYCYHCGKVTHVRLAKCRLTNDEARQVMQAKFVDW